MMKYSIFVLSLLFSFECILSMTSCANQNECNSCISTSNCVWCSVPLTELHLNNKEFTRCVHKSEINSSWCSQEYIVDGRSSMSKIDRDFTSDDGNNGAIQIRPQSVHVKLKVGEKLEIPIKYKAAHDYPVDIYFLMDLSTSMLGTKNQLSLFGKELVQAMTNLTKNFQIGFGSFVDKTEMPFVDTRSELLIDPCQEKPLMKCVSPYGFRNHLSLTSNGSLFSSIVSKAKMSGNLDGDEGSLDALLQAIVCKKEIGWRDKSRKLIIISTDAGFHFAGDGKLAGIVEPNDGECHLENGYYTHSTQQDYPSIALINEKVNENDMNVIFAVNNTVLHDLQNVYEDLVSNIDGANHTSSGSSFDIVKFTQDQYKKLVSKIVLSDNSPDHIEIKYFSQCPDSHEMESNQCENLRGKSEAAFKIYIQALKCPDDRKLWSQDIKIKAEGLDIMLNVKVDIICECDCMKNRNEKSDECSRNGDLMCGICTCDSGFYGKICECNNESTNLTRHDQCTSPNGITCNNLGICLCGQCECNRRENPQELIYGSQCECDNFSCPRNEGVICSGVGQCDCKQCVCQPGWSGEACECNENYNGCIAPGSDAICSGKGECKCGVCHCNIKDEFKYSGKYCDKCPHCLEICKQLKDCVECQVHQTGKYATNCSTKCTEFKANVVEKLNKEIDVERLCKFPDEHGCTYTFRHEYNEQGEVKVFAEKEKQCPHKINIIGLISGVAGGILVGAVILLIVWKVLVTMHDRREYSRFLNDLASAKWADNTNPLYKSSTTKYRNPRFRFSVSKQS